MWLRWHSHYALTNWSTQFCGYNVCYSIVEWLADTPCFLLWWNTATSYAESARSRIYPFWHLVHWSNFRGDMYTPTDPVLHVYDWDMLSNTLWTQDIQKPHGKVHRWLVHKLSQTVIQTFRTLMILLKHAPNMDMLLQHAKSVLQLSLSKSVSP